MKTILKYCLLLVLLLNTSLVFSQNDIILVNSNNSKKTRYLNEFSEISIICKDSLGINNYHDIIKNYDSATEFVIIDSICKIEPLTVSIYRYEKDNMFKPHFWYISETNYGEPGTHEEEFFLKDIYTVTYKAKLRDYIGLISAFSAITTFIVSPIISIDFKNKGFNNDLYYYTAGISAGIYLVSLGITLNINDKTIRTNNFLQENEEDYWIIKHNTTLNKKH